MASRSQEKCYLSHRDHGIKKETLLVLHLPCLGNTVLQPLCNMTVNLAAKGMLTSAWGKTAGAFAGAEMSFLNPCPPLKTEGSRRKGNTGEMMYQRETGWFGEGGISHHFPSCCCPEPLLNRIQRLLPRSPAAGGLMHRVQKQLKILSTMDFALFEITFISPCALQFLAGPVLGQAEAGPEPKFSFLGSGPIWTCTDQKDAWAARDAGEQNRHKHHLPRQSAAPFHLNHRPCHSVWL